MGLAATGGGVKTITHYKFTGLTNPSTLFGTTFTITAVASVAKTMLRINGYHSEGEANSSILMLHLNSTTAVQYSFDIATSAQAEVAFSVIEYY
jgi:hypothetical protein